MLNAALVLVLCLTVAKSIAMSLASWRSVTSGGALVDAVRRVESNTDEIRAEMYRLSPIDHRLAQAKPPAAKAALIFVFRGYSAVSAASLVVLIAGTSHSASSWLILAVGIAAAACTLLLLLTAVLRRLILGYEDWRTLDVELPALPFAQKWAVYAEQGSNVPIYFLVLMYLAVVGFAGLYSSINAVNGHAFATSSASSAITWLYFSITTVSTIGFGDVHPQSAGAQIAVISQIAAGPLLLSWLIAVLLTPKPTRD
jgi:hypothetical protein